MAFQNFFDLEVYKVCREFRINISKIAKENFPKQEQFTLTNQVLRSSRSVTANIAEGHGRFFYQENIQFCRIARGSLSETLEHLICAFDEKYISNERLTKVKADYDQCLKLLNGYISFLKSKKSKTTKSTK